MKKSVQTLVIAACLCAPAAFGQGLVGFSNTPGSAVIDGITGEPATGAAGYTVGLYWSRDASAAFNDFTLAGTTPILNLGVFNNGGLPIAVEGAAPGDVIYVQIRAWTGGFDNYQNAIDLGDPLSDYAGSSETTNPLTLAAPGSPFQSLVVNGGLQSFMTTPVPEPSTIAFGILGGIGAMVLLRRRK